MALKEDYKDDVFDGARKYRMVNNSDGTVSLIDVTNYTQEGDLFGAKDLNGITGTVNELSEPTFEDYTGDTEVPAASTALENIKSKGPLKTLLSNIKAFCKGCITLAMLVNDTATNNSKLPVSAAVAYDLQQQINVQNTKSQTTDILISANVEQLNNYSVHACRIGDICFVSGIFNPRDNCVDSMLFAFADVKLEKTVIFPVACGSSNIGFGYSFAGSNKISFTINSSIGVDCRFFFVAPIS